MKNKRLFDMIKSILVVILGNFFFALVMYSLISPSGIIIGGITGIGITLERTIHINAEWFILPVNIVILIFGWIVLGRKMVITSVASSILYPLFLALFRYIPNMTNITNNQLLVAILGGAGVGTSVGFLMRVGASTGGTDILSLAFHKWFHIPVSTVVFIFDFTIIFSQIFVSNIEMALYGIIYSIVETIVIRNVMLIGQTQIQLTIVSDKYEVIRNLILNELHCGVTMLHVETGCRGQEQLSLMCVIHPRQLFETQRSILLIDPQAFIIVTQIKEVRGQGFTLEKVDMVPVSSLKNNE